MIGVIPAKTAQLTIFFFSLPPDPRDLAIKQMFVRNPVLWQCLHLISDMPSSTSEPPISEPSTSPSTSEPPTSGLIVCAPIVRSLLTVLTQHWQRCCVDTVSLFPRELQYSISLVQCMAKVVKS